MKQILRNIMLFGVATAMFSSCGDEPEVTKRESDLKATLELSKTELKYSKQAGSLAVLVTTTESWVAETPADWVSLSPLAGNGDGAITISVKENTQDVARESYVKISTKSDEKMIVVVQSSDTSNGGENGEENGEENGNENGGGNQQGNVTTEKGAIKAAFSVSDSKQVYFSQGNLQYQASTNTWRFAEHQWDFVGDSINGNVYENGVKSDNLKISPTYDGWIDLFGWGTSGWNSGANAYQPYSTSASYGDYYPGGDYTNNLTGSYANADWGVYNKISNGGNQAGLWRTLTKDEWQYLISGRAQASRLMGQGRVNNVNGLILLPDGWETPSSVKFTYDPGNYSTNVYSLDEWAVMESYGAVFLPAADNRFGADVDDVGSDGYYWSSSANGRYDAHYLSFFSDYVGTDYGSYRNYGRSVRLVRGL